MNMATGGAGMATGGAGSEHAVYTVTCGLVSSLLTHMVCLSPPVVCRSLRDVLTHGSYKRSRVGADRNMPRGVSYTPLDAVTART